MPHDPLETLVNEFVESLRLVIRQQAVEALRESLGTNGASAKANGVPATRKNGSNTRPRILERRRKGAKRDPSDLDALKQKFLSFVAGNEGLRIEQINKELGTTTKDLQLPIRKLIAEGAVKAKGQKRSTTYSVSGKARKKSAK